MIGILYPSTRQVAYSSLFYRLARNRLLELRAYSGSYFLEDGSIRSDTRQSPTRARILLVSLPYELLYRDYAEMLFHLGALPRGQGAWRDTVIIAGGPAVTANPAPVLELVDAVAVGEIDDIFDDIVDIGLSSQSRAETLRRLSELPGFLVPGHTEPPVERHYVRDLDASTITLNQEIPQDAEPVWGRSYIVETSRGCGRGCRFCMEGFIFRPKRDRSIGAIREMLVQAKKQEYGKVSFYSLSFFDNPAAERALEEAHALGLEYSVPSLRADTLNERRLQLIGAGGQKTLTVAPETGSCRLCRAINKRIPPSTIEWVASVAPNYGIRSLKLYLITGFPGETEEDWRETLNLTLSVARILRRRGLRLKVSLNPFIPKPVTPLQWAPLADLKLLRKRQREYAKLLRREGNVEPLTYDPRWAVAQLVLSRGGSEVSRLILEWARTGRGLGAFRRAARIVGINLDRYTGPLPLDRVPVWHELVSHPYARLDTLRREYRLYTTALAGRL